MPVSGSKLSSFGLAGLFLIFSCSSPGESKPAEKETAAPQETRGKMVEITSEDQFTRILENSPDRLLVFDLYADWCMPCKVLTPMLKEIAAEHADKASFYMINVDNLRSLAAAFRVQGIPFVVFVKNKTGVFALTGVQPKGAYVRAITMHSGTQTSETPRDQPDGTIIEGIRVIRLSPQMAPGNLYVYRGETVKLVIDSLDFEYSLHLPDFDVSAAGKPGEQLSVTFKVEKTGVFPLYCNGNCPSGDGAGFGQVVVMQYQAVEGSTFRELDAKEAKTFIDSDTPLILDVRTPHEYYTGAIPGATLIPLSQLEKRVSEISAHAKKPVLVYCRSGNRSTVAAEILIEKGFTHIVHLRPGIIGWQTESLPVTKPR